jgi:hypothetical protein
VSVFRPLILIALLHSIQRISLEHFDAEFCQKVDGQGLVLLIAETMRDFLRSEEAVIS